MANKKNTKKVNVTNKKYIVMRDGHKVSEFEYDSPELASSEFNFWKRVIVQGKDFTSKVEIVEK